MSRKIDSRGKTMEERLLDALSQQSINQEKIIELLQELSKWVKVTSYPQVGKILNEQVQSEAQKIVYANSDGIRTTKEFFELSGMYSPDVSENWKKWARAGIAKQVPVSGGTRGKSLFSLEEFGIEVPKNKTEKVVDMKKLVKAGNQNAQSFPKLKENQT
jgi:hypothetical protein